MQVKPNQVPIKCDCESLACEFVGGFHQPGGCELRAIVKVHAFGLAANLCARCQNVWARECPEATFGELPTQVKAAELKTPKGKTFPRAARASGGAA